METLKTKILEILNAESETMHGAGSCGELGDSCQAINSDYYPDVADKILNLIQIVFDPENQPNQLSIKNPFERFCMPDEVVDEETHEQYLKDIGVRK